MNLANGFLRFGGFVLGENYDTSAKPKYGAYVNKENLRTKDGELLTLGNLFKARETPLEAGERKIYTRGRIIRVIKKGAVQRL